MMSNFSASTQNRLREKQQTRGLKKIEEEAEDSDETEDTNTITKKKKVTFGEEDQSTV